MALATMAASSADIFAPLDSIERSLEKYVSNLRIGDRLRDAVAYAIANGAVTGQLWTGQWIDVGTVERLEEADLALRLAAIDQRL